MAAAGHLPPSAAPHGSALIRDGISLPVFSPLATCSIAQGRYIVHRAGSLSENMHEVIVDLQGLKFTAAGEIVKHGTFSDVAASLGALQSGLNFGF